MSDDPLFHSLSSPCLLPSCLSFFQSFLSFSFIFLPFWDLFQNLSLFICSEAVGCRGFKGRLWVCRIAVLCITGCFCHQDVWTLLHALWLSVTVDVLFPLCAVCSGLVRIWLRYTSQRYGVVIRTSNSCWRTEETRVWETRWEITHLFHRTSDVESANTGLNTGEGTFHFKPE